MEEKKIIIKINDEPVEMLSNNPDLKSLIIKIIEQDDEYNFDFIGIECNDDKFDKVGFKEILVKAIKEFKKNLILDEIESKNNMDKIKDINDKLISSNSQ